MEPWILLALGSAFFQGLRNVAMKRIGHALDQNINVWGRFTFLLPFTGATTLWFGLPELQPGFWAWCLAFAVSQNLATLSLSRALLHSDISLVTTLWKVSMIFLVVWGFLALGEQPTPIGLVGILLAVAGVYLVNASRTQVVWYAPFLALARDRGQVYTLLSAFFYAPSVITIKQLALLSDAYFATFMGYLTASLLLTPVVLHTSRTHFREIPRHWKDFLGLGIFAALSTIFTTKAYTLTLSSYVEAVKQVEILLALALGVVLFGEKARVRAIWPGSLLMLLGLVLLKLYG
ncbi:MAG: EamA family transporter [Deltaproteobacteria bacterium]|nr:EamA family transporter [Deltaproteobacteria bacterium]